MKLREAWSSPPSGSKHSYFSFRTHNGAQVVVAKGSPYVAAAHRVSGVLLSNSTAVRHIFDRTLGTYDLLMQRKAQPALSPFPTRAALMYTSPAKAQHWPCRRLHQASACPISQIASLREMLQKYP